MFGSDGCNRPYGTCKSAAASYPGLKSWAKANHPSGPLHPSPFLALRCSARAVCRLWMTMSFRIGGTASVMGRA